MHQAQGRTRAGNRTGRLLLGAVMVAAALVGCKGPAESNRPKPYFGPTEPLDAVVAKVNANNAKIPTLWAHQDVEATVVDDKGKSHFVNGYGTLQYRARRDLRLIAKKEVTDLFEVGSNDQQFWLRVVPEEDALWWGNYKNLGKPCAKPIPIRPDLILQVLGVGPVETDFLREPVPVLRFNNDFDTYMLVWQSRRRDRWVADKEVWYDRVTLHPTLALLFDENGRVVLRARLAAFAPVDASPLPREQWPVMATQYNLFFPDTGTKMSFTLKDVAVSHNGFPKDASFRLPSTDPGDYKQVIQIDEGCGDTDPIGRAEVK